MIQVALIFTNINTLHFFIFACNLCFWLKFFGRHWH